MSQFLVSLWLPVFSYIPEKKNKERSKAKKWLIKIIILDIFLTLVYLISGIIEGRNFLYPSVLLKTFLFGDVICVHLWYLTALWQALLIFILLRKHDKLFYFCLLFFLFNPAIRYYCKYIGIVNIPDYYTRNCFGCALPYLCTGYLIAKYKYKFKTSYFYFIGAIVCFILIKLINFYFFALNASLAILIFLTFYKYNYQIPKFISNLGKEHSANIYYYHMMTVSFLSYLREYIFFFNNFSAIYIFILSFFISILVNKIQATYFHKSLS